jgi:hypothetical protein
LAAATEIDMLDCYTAILPTLRDVARAHGYALGLHGSTERDLDLIAVPWVEDAADEATFIEALRSAVNGTIFSRTYPYAKPHGRRAWVIYIEGPPISTGGAPYIDLSVMPKT